MENGEWRIRNWWGAVCGRDGGCCCCGGRGCWGLFGGVCWEEVIEGEGSEGKEAEQPDKGADWEGAVFFVGAHWFLPMAWAPW